MAEKIRIRNHSDIFGDNLRNTDTGIIFGTGPSINDITPEKWERLRKYDTWSLNWFILHDFMAPRFYYRTEQKANPVKTRIFKHHYEQKKELYKDTIWLTAGGGIKTCKMIEFKAVGIPEVYVINLSVHFSKGVLKRKGPRAYEDALENFRLYPDKIMTVGRSSLVHLVILMHQMGYKEIVLYGVDLKDRKYFWSNRKDLSRVWWRWNRDRRNPTATYQAKTVHPNMDSTVRFLPWFSEKYMNNQIYIGTKKSELINHLPAKRMRDL